MATSPRLRRRGRGGSRSRRKFTWDRSRGIVTVGAAGPVGVDLLAAYRAQPGATHLGATITRIRGYVYPELGTALETAVVSGVVGFRVDSWNESATDVTNSPLTMPDEDWLGWLPWLIDGTQTPQSPNVATWNNNEFTVDIRAARKLEELNQTLWMFFQPAPAGGTYFLNYDLSIGFKLA